jgi:hypothetical protein
MKKLLNALPLLIAIALLTIGFRSLSSHQTASTASDIPPLLDL